MALVRPKVIFFWGGGMLPPTPQLFYNERERSLFFIIFPLLHMLPKILSFSTIFLSFCVQGVKPPTFCYFFSRASCTFFSWQNFLPPPHSKKNINSCVCPCPKNKQFTNLCDLSTNTYIRIIYIQRFVSLKWCSISIEREMYVLSE